MKNKTLGWGCLTGAIAAAMLLAFWLTACASVTRTTYVGIGAGSGAALGSLIGPAGTIGGAAVGAAIVHAVVEADESETRARHATDRLVGTPYTPPPGPFDWFRWYYGLAALWIWLRRAHIMDALSGREPRWDAILRALGWRTHRTPIKRTA